MQYVTKNPITTHMLQRQDMEGSRDALWGGAFHVYSTGTTLALTTTFTTVLFSQVYVDAFGEYNTATGRYTPGYEGFYVFGFSGIVQSTTGAIIPDASTICSITKNGTRIADARACYIPTANYAGLSCTAIAYANGTTDYFTIDAYSDPGAGNVALWLGGLETTFCGGFLNILLA